MPKRMHAALKREAAKRGMTGERADRFIYGTLNRYEQGKKKKGKKKK